MADDKRYPTLDEHLFKKGVPKRILALDGGGIRGILTLGYLKRMEDILRQRVGGDPDFRLCDYFDLIGGTSTGSIIAAGLAMGFSVDKLQTLYRSLAAEVFKKPFYRVGLYAAKFPEGPLNEALKRQFGDELLGSDKLRTGLMIMTKRFDTGSPWVLHNNPEGKYFKRRAGSTGAPNGEFILKQLVRASTAAPHYFEPEKFKVADLPEGPLEGAFVDGGVSPYNNPSFQLLMLATLKGYRLEWPLGRDNLLLVSVGTGHRELRLKADDVMQMPASLLALRTLVSLMDDCDAMGQTILQWLSNSPTAQMIDREVGSLQDDLLAGRELLQYLRYNVELDSDWIKKTLNMTMDDAHLADLYEMDRPQNVPALADLGEAAAAVQMKDEHFPTSFDPCAVFGSETTEPAQ